MTHPVLMAVSVAAGIFVLSTAAASAQTRIYPPGTDCANQPTIAEWLLCGRQEFRHQSETSVPQPPPVDGLPERQLLRSPTIDEGAPAEMPTITRERTASPNH